MPYIVGSVNEVWQSISRAPFGRTLFNLVEPPEDDVRMLRNITLVGSDVVGQNTETVRSQSILESPNCYSHTADIDKIMAPPPRTKEDLKYYALRYPPTHSDSC